MILLYHRVATPTHDPFTLAVPPDWFADHLEVIQSRSRVVSLEAMLRPEADPGVRAAITFDDGYLDNLRVASPLLRDAGMPATYFICTGSLGDVRGFWWDRLVTAMATSATPAVINGVEGLPPFDDLGNPAALSNAMIEIAARLQQMHPVAREELLSELETRLLAGGDGAGELCPILDAAGVRDLAAQPLTELGAHTRSHPTLSSLTSDEQRDEIAHSVETLHEITGTRPRYFAYPYGGEQDYNTDSCLAAEHARMSAAFVNHAGRFDPVGRPYIVPRYSVPPLQADAFRSWFDRISAA